MTSADVARLAGVSQATVSYALSGGRHARVAEATRARVAAAAAELGYTPSASARALRTGHNQVVLLLLPTWATSSRWGKFIVELTERLAEHGLVLMTHVVARSGGPERELWSHIAPGAVLSFFELDAEVVGEMRAAGIHVHLGVFGHDALLPFEHAFPDEQFGRTQVAHLHSRGHTRLGFTWPTDPQLAVFANGRLNGVKAECADRGLPAPSVVEIGPVGPASGAGDAVQRWAGDVTAVCGYNDEYALGVLHAATTAGLDVPGQLAIIGVDDIEAGLFTIPTLSTVTYEIAAIARYAAQTAAAHLTDGAIAPAAPEQAAFVRLIVRGST